MDYEYYIAAIVFGVFATGIVGYYVYLQKQCIKRLEALFSNEEAIESLSIVSDGTCYFVKIIHKFHGLIEITVENYHGIKNVKCHFMDSGLRLSGEAIRDSSIVSCFSNAIFERSYSFRMPNPVDIDNNMGAYTSYSFTDIEHGQRSIYLCCLISNKIPHKFISFHMDKKMIYKLILPEINKKFLRDKLIRDKLLS